MSTHHFHAHGGTPERDIERLGIKTGPVLDFSVNISPLGPPEKIINAWRELAPEIRFYPSIEGDGIVRFYQERFGLPQESILAGNGSTELIYLVPRALDLKRVTIIVPSFHDYTRASELAAAKIVPLSLSADNYFEPLDLEIIGQILEQSDALFLGNPNNPTGTTYSAEMLLQIADNFTEKWILVDEAFVQFMDDYRSATLMTNERLRPNILVFHSLTKFYAIPGLRLGCVISLPDTIARLRPFKEPWTVNRIAEKVAVLLIDCREYDETLRQLIQYERTSVHTRIKGINGIQTFIPSANFFLAKWTATNNLDDLLKSLLSEGLYVRDCRNFPGLEANYFRFAIRCPKDNDRLLSALKKCTRKYYV